MHQQRPPLPEESVHISPERKTPEKLPITIVSFLLLLASLEDEKDRLKNKMKREFSVIYHQEKRKSHKRCPSFNFS
jgi:hypothetical protein